MFRNYLTTALRVLQRQKIYSGINILGLTVGVTASLLILLYVVDETRYDNFHTHSKDIYRLTFHGRMQGEDFVTAQVGMPVAAAVQTELPEAEAVVRLAKWNTYPIRYNEKAFTERNFYIADSNFFSFFDFELIAGNKDELLKGPNKIVISERAARKYFDYKGPGDESPIGKLMLGGSGGESTYQVTGIAKDQPNNSHFHFDFVLSMDSWDFGNNSIWLNSATATYVRLHPQASQAALDAKMEEFVKKYCAAEIQQFLNQSLEEFLGQGGDIGYGSQRLLDIHLHSNLQDEFEPNGNIQYVYMFSAIAFFILLLACINFMNLSTARSANRAKEVGIRKTIGAFRSRLMGQFMMESFIYALLAFTFALALAGLLLQPFNALSGKEISMDMVYHPLFVGGILLLVIVVGLVAGSYPAFYLTAFKPAEVLKGKVRAGMRSSGIRNTLVVFQFVISIALIICSIMVYKQLNHLQEQSLGFQKENVIDLLHTANLGKNGEAFKNELLQYPDVLGASYSNRLPPNIDWTTSFMDPKNGASYFLAIYTMDHDHLKTMGYEMKEGRFFSRDHPSDTAAMILNERAALNLGITDWQGKKLQTYFNSQDGTYYEIIGIMKDFNFESLKSTIRPMAIMLAPSPHWEMAIRITPGQVQEKVERIESIWKKYAPQTPFEFSFMDQNFDAKYRAEQRFGQVILVFTSLAIFIACLGLFGLAAFTAEQRSKEISIRKVMGASIPQIMTLLTKDFTRLVLIAFAIAIPITWFAMNKWLESFAYRINYEITWVAMAGFVATFIALLTISMQALKAALGNPVNSLRGE